MPTSFVLCNGGVKRRKGTFAILHATARAALQRFWTAARFIGLSRASCNCGSGSSPSIMWSRRRTESIAPLCSIPNWWRRCGSHADRIRVGVILRRTMRRKTYRRTLLAGICRRISQPTSVNSGCSSLESKAQQRSGEELQIALRKWAVGGGPGEISGTRLR